MSVTKDGKNLKYYKHTFDLSPIHFDQYGNEEVTNVPLATIYMSFKGMDDPIVCNNAELCELSFESNSEDSPTLTPTFNSDYLNSNTINILRMFRVAIRSRTAPSNSVRVFIGKTDAESIDQMTEIECYQSASFDFKDGSLTGSIKFSRTEITRHISQRTALVSC